MWASCAYHLRTCPRRQPTNIQLVGTCYRMRGLSRGSRYNCGILVILLAFETCRIDKGDDDLAGYASDRSGDRCLVARRNTAAADFRRRDLDHGIDRFDRLSTKKDWITESQRHRESKNNRVR